MYNSTVGRWISRDPIEFAAGDGNLYRYVGNDPTNATDPSGEFLWTILGGIFGGAAGFVTGLVNGEGFNLDRIAAGAASGALAGAGVDLFAMSFGLATNASAALIGAGIGSAIGSGAFSSSPVSWSGFAQGGVTGAFVGLSIANLPAAYSTLGIKGLAAVTSGAFVGGAALNGVRQLAQYADRTRQGFSLGEALLAGGLTAAAAPGFIMAPWVGVPLATGAAGFSALNEGLQGHGWTAAVDASTGLLPWGFRSVRTAVAEQIPLPQAIAQLRAAATPQTRILPGGTQHTLAQARTQFGQGQLIGVVEVSPEGARVTAGTYASSKNHLTLSKTNLGPVQVGQQRFGFMMMGDDVVVGPSSTGFVPKVSDIPAIRQALQQQGFLTPGARIVIEESAGGPRAIYNLSTGERVN